MWEGSSGHGRQVVRQANAGRSRRQSTQSHRRANDAPGDTAGSIRASTAWPWQPGPAPRPQSTRPCPHPLSLLLSLPLLQKSRRSVGGLWRRRRQLAACCVAHCCCGCCCELVRAPGAGRGVQRWKASTRGAGGRRPEPHRPLASRALLLDEAGSDADISELAASASKFSVALAPPLRPLLLPLRRCRRALVGVSCRCRVACRQQRASSREDKRVVSEAYSKEAGASRGKRGTR